MKKIEPSLMTTDAITDEIADLEEQRKDINGRLAALRLQLALDACPYKIGEVLVDQRGNRARVDEIIAPHDFLQGKVYAMRGVFLKKNGMPAMNPGRDNYRSRTCGFHEWEHWKRPEGESK